MEETGKVEASGEGQSIAYPQQWILGIQGLENPQVIRRNIRGTLLEQFWRVWRLSVGEKDVHVFHIVHDDGAVSLSIRNQLQGRFNARIIGPGEQVTSPSASRVSWRYLDVLWLKSKYKILEPSPCGPERSCICKGSPNNGEFSLKSLVFCRTKCGPPIDGSFRRSG